MAPSIIFPILEVELVKALNAMLALVDLPIARDVYVSTDRAPADFTPYPTKQITVRSDGGLVVQSFLKEESFGLNLWASSHREASELAALVEALLPLIPTKSRGSLKNVSIDMTAISVNEPGTEEQRYITGTALVGSQSFTL